MALLLPKMSALISRQSAKALANCTRVLAKKINRNGAIIHQINRLMNSSQKGFLSTVSVPQHKQPEFKNVTNGLELSIPGAGFDKPLFVDYLWLYDHCRCPKCFFGYTNQKEVDPRYVTEDVKPQEIQITNNELRITWADGHSYNYSLDWILDNLHEGVPRVEKIKRTGWNSSMKPSEFPTVIYNPSSDKDTLARQVLRGIFEYGFCLVENAPTTKEESETFFRSIVPIQKVFKDEVFTIQVQNEFPDTAFTNSMLPPHNDGTYLTETPGLIALNCLSQSNQGGESFLTDGVYVAGLLKRKNPEAYECLTTQPIESNYISKADGVHYKHCETLLRLHPYTKELLQIRYNTSDICPIKIIPQREIRQWYRSLAALSHELFDSANQIKFRLTPGKMYVIDNWTLVHGRMAFNGDRQLVGCFMGHKSTYSRGRVLGLI